MGKIFANAKCYKAVYAVYGDYGETYLFSGTAEEVADYLGMDPGSISCKSCRCRGGRAESKIQVFGLGHEVIPMADRVELAIKGARKSPVRDKKPDAWAKGFDCALAMLQEALVAFRKQDDRQREKDREELERLFGL